jgi:glucosamine kinase
MALVLAVDLGKTGCRLALWSAGDRSDAGDTAAAKAIASGVGAPGLAEMGGVDAACSAIAQAWPRLASAEPPASICVGAAGSAAAPQARRELAMRLGQRWTSARIAVASDATTSHAGALAGRAGVVLAAGTGAVVIGAGVDGRVVQVDGWGPWLGDEGSGGWIGRAGLRAVLAAHDGRGEPTSLTQAARTAFGQDPAGIPAAIGGHPQPVRALAAFAPQVAAAAAEGDLVAATIVSSAVQALRAAVLAAVRGLRFTGPAPTALVGGLLQLAPIRTALTASLGQDDEVVLTPARGDALDGARWLAEHQDTVHEASLTRVWPERGAA